MIDSLVFLALFGGSVIGAAVTGGLVPALVVLVLFSIAA